MATINQINNTLNDPTVNDGDFNMPIITAPVISSGIFSGTINSSTINSSTIDAIASGVVQNWNGLIKTTTNPSYASTTSVSWSGASADNLFGTFSVGDKVTLIQSGGRRYYYIRKVDEISGLPSSLTLTLIGDPSILVLNQAITEFYYNKGNEGSTLNRHPVWFNYTPTFGGFSVNPSNAVYKFKLDNNWCTVVVSQGTAGTSNATNFSISAPIVAKTVTNMVWVASLPYAVNSGSVSTTKDDVQIASNQTQFTLSKNMSSTGWTSSGNKHAYFTICYEI